jgi:hypothetical protein
MKELRKAGKSYPAIAADLDARGVRTKEGGRLLPMTNASPIAHDGCLLMRTDQYLYCLGSKR